MKFGGAEHWGPGVPRYRTSPSNWAKPLTWNKAALGTEFAGRKGFWPVFCSSLADVFDNEVPDEWRTDLFNLIDATPYLSWLLVTKRIGNVRGMLPDRWSVAVPDHVRILITVVNQEEVDRDVPKLLSLPCKNGISYEPALGPVNWSRWLAANDLHKIDGGPRLGWLIVGGESNQGANKARPLNIEWARSTVKQCRAADVPVFVKQMGSNPQEVAYPRLVSEQEKNRWHAAGWTSIHEGANTHWRKYYRFNDRAGADPYEWPEDLWVREFPS